MVKLETASKLLGEIDQISTSSLMELDFIVEALKNTEALASARIEGTTGNLEDLYQHETLNYDKKLRLKLFGATNYRLTINRIENILSLRPKIDRPLLETIHKDLLNNDPSSKGVPGEFRKKDVKIANSKLGDFFPPTHIKVPEFIHWLFKDIGPKQLPLLIQIAIRHYQFEAIHPFEDGNGRTGRLLIVAEMLSYQLLHAPVLNLSQYLERHRDKYVHALRQVSDQLTYAPWVEFFLDAVVAQCRHNIALIQTLKNIRQENTTRRRLSMTATMVLDYSLNHLFLTIPQVESHLKQAGAPLKNYYQTARLNVQKLIAVGILVPSHKNGKEMVYIHQGLREVLIPHHKTQ